MSSPAERLRRRILDSGPVPFFDFMEEALYGEGGYYHRQALAIGKEGDFVTGSSLSPLFGRATARLLQRLDRALERRAGYLEAGYGWALHLRAVVESLPDSAERRLLAWDRVRRPVPEGVEALGDTDLEALQPVQGLIFSYELFDALAVHRLIGRDDGSMGELWVDCEEERFEYRPGELSKPELRQMVDQMHLELAPGQVADLSPDWRPTYGRLASRLETGLLVTCDYGFERAQLLDPRIRPHGTLACHSRQQVHRRALHDVGKQDLTAHVDFTTLREEGERQGLETLALTRQAFWLVACGIFEDLDGASAEERVDARTLLDPAGMGEEIRVLVQGRGVSADSLFEVALTGPRPSIQ